MRQEKKKADPEPVPQQLARLAVSCALSSVTVGGQRSVLPDGLEDDQTKLSRLRAAGVGQFARVSTENLQQKVLPLWRKAQQQLQRSDAAAAAAIEATRLSPNQPPAPLFIAASI